MKTFDIVMYILAAICFLVGWAGFRQPTDRPWAWASWHWISLGLLFWVLVPLVTLIHD